MAWIFKHPRKYNDMLKIYTSIMERATTPAWVREHTGIGKDVQKTIMSHGYSYLQFDCKMLER